MKFPFDSLQFVIPFSKIQLDDWIALYQPASIEMNDRQYAHLAHIVGANIKEYRGIPIQFVPSAKQ